MVGLKPRLGAESQSVMLAVVVRTTKTHRANKVADVRDVHADL